MVLNVNGFVRAIVAFAIAVLSTAVVASIVQTQINLAALSALGAPLTLTIRAVTTLQDVITFGPVMAAIATAALLPAIPAGHAIALAVSSRWRALILAVAGAVGLWTTFSVMGFFTPMPTLVAAVRGSIGHAIMGTTGLVGGLIYANLTKPEALPG